MSSKLVKRSVFHGTRVLAICEDGYVGIGGLEKKEGDMWLIRFEGKNRVEWVPVVRCHSLIFTQLVNSMKSVTVSMNQMLEDLKNKSRFLEKAKEREVPMNLMDVLVSMFSPTAQRAYPALRAANYGDMTRYLAHMDSTSTAIQRSGSLDSYLGEYVCFVDSTGLYYGVVNDIGLEGMLTVRVLWPCTNKDQEYEVDKSLVLTSAPVILGLHTFMSNYYCSFPYPFNTTGDIPDVLKTVGIEVLDEYNTAYETLISMKEE